MDKNYYLREFKNIASKLDEKILSESKIEIKVGEWIDSVVIKLQKKLWSNPQDDLIPSEASIFFSIWVNEKSIKESKIFYNIHALKLRQLKGYTIQSREFAESFRNKFNKFEASWPNVSVNYGPQTLMQGWEKVEFKNLEKTVLKLAEQFFKIHFLIDDLLSERK